MIQKWWNKYIFILVNAAIAVVIVFPLLYCLSGSFMTEGEIFSSVPRLLPSSLSGGNYAAALRMAPLFRFIFNSAVVAVACTFAQLLTGSLAGYAFALLKFKGQKTLFLLFLATMMIPGYAIIISNYLTIANFKLNDTYAALILPYMTSAFCVFNMRQAFLSLPSELNESAKIDGCNSLQFYYRIGLPLTVPFLGSLGIYTFLSVWNQYMWPLLVTNTTGMRTVQIGLGMLRFADSNAFGPIMAGSIIVMIPSVAVFLLGQKSLIKGLTTGAVKG